MEYAPANPQDHGPVTGDQNAKGSLVAASTKIVQELSVAVLVRCVPGGQLVDVLKNKGKLGHRHGRDFSHFGLPAL
jgi:hypothetical protein